MLDFTTAIRRLAICKCKRSIHWCCLQDLQVLSPVDVAAMEGLAPPPIRNLFMRLQGSRGSFLRFGAPLSSLVCRQAAEHDNLQGPAS